MDNAAEAFNLKDYYGYMSAYAAGAAVSVSTFIAYAFNSDNVDPILCGAAFTLITGLASNIAFQIEYDAREDISYSKSFVYGLITPAAIALGTKFLLSMG